MRALAAEAGAHPPSVCAPAFFSALRSFSLARSVNCLRRSALARTSFSTSGRLELLRACWNITISAALGLGRGLN